LLIAVITIFYSKDFIINLWQTDYEKAEEYEKNKKYREAIKLYKIEASKENLDALNKIGNLYLNHFKNYKSAQYWFSLGANSGHTEAQYNLFLLYANKKLEFFNKEKALFWLNKSALSGHKKAKELLYKIKLSNQKKEQEKIRIFKNTKTIEQALKYNSVELLEKVLTENNEDVNKKLWDGYTPLLIAVRKNNLEIVKYLVEHGANLKAKNKYGDTVFHRVAWNRGDYKITEYLTKMIPAYINEKDQYGHTPLDAVLRSNTLQKGGSIQATKVLLENGADKVINEKFRGFTPLMVSSPNVEVMKLLISYGADPDIRNNQGRTTLENTKFYSKQVDTIHGTKKYKQELKKQYKEAIEYLLYYTTVDRYKENLPELIQLTHNDKGLMWERKTAKNRHIHESKKYCNNLKWAEYDDWRLPTAKEYESIMLKYPILNKPIDGVDQYYMNPKQFPNMVPWEYLIKIENGYGTYSVINKKVKKKINLNKQKYYVRCIRTIR